MEWEVITDITGPQGERGEPGADSTVPGPTGPQGEAGEDYDPAALDALAASTTTALATKREKVSGEYRLADFGTVDLTGATDTTAVLNAALAAMHAAGGGTLLFPAGRILIAGQILPPQTTAVGVAPKQVPMVWQGQASVFAGQGVSVPLGGTILVVTYDNPGLDTDAKLLTTGIGKLSIRDISFYDPSPSATTFIKSTGTTLDISQCGFFGSAATSSLCNQDAIWLGGSNPTHLDGDPEGGFQGYGTVIKENYFSKIRRILFGRTFCNGIVFRDNIAWATCGTNLVDGACIEFNGDPYGDNGGNFCVGNLIAGNLIEIQGYKYGIKLQWFINGGIVNNNGFDFVSGTIAMVRMENKAGLNVVIDGSGQIGKLYSDGATATPGFNTRIATSEASQVAYGMNFLSSDGVKSKAFVAGPLGRVDITDLSNVVVATLSARSWVAPGVGGAMTINSGTGGSYLDLRNFGVRFYDHNSGPLRVSIGKGLDGLQLGAAFDVTVQRDAAVCLAVNRPVKTQATTTALRPSAATVGVGAQIYDTTLAKPLWSDGTVWRDAGGTSA